VASDTLKFPRRATLSSSNHLTFPPWQPVVALIPKASHHLAYPENHDSRSQPRGNFPALASPGRRRISLRFRLRPKQFAGNHVTMIPQFLVIGTQKSGTTWLDRNLRAHPEIWLPPEKEIHYFNLPKNIPFTWFVISRDREARRWVLNRMRRACRKVKADPGLFFWYWRYYTLPRTKRWYSKLFQPNAGQLAGEVTPHYAVMPERDITGIRALRNDMKMVYLLRNPIERMWSHAAMQFSIKYNHQGIGTMDERAILDFMLKPNNLAHARYSDNLERWEKHFPGDRMFIGFFDEISENPKRLLSGIFQFVGVTDSTEYITELAMEKVYGGKYPPIPRHVAVMLAGIFIDDLERLHQRLQSPYTAKWLAQCRSLLEADGG
jgi:hypothetical protein